MCALAGAIVLAFALVVPAASAGEPHLPPLVCFIDADGQSECIDTVFQADTIVDCGGARDLFAYGSSPGVMSIGYTDQGRYHELKRAKYQDRFWQPPDSTLLVYHDSDWLNGSDFERCYRWSYFDDPNAWPVPTDAGPL